ncbi:carboxylate--amine ligase [Pseudomonas sp. FW215-R2]|jgi:biotin carboxylase|uniref:ATP-grasp domain-containing protein n=1 Tax=unclassified Pseudomonas TaxID=196821 RepID=UPI000C88DE09|nr:MULTISPECIES: ATP-grasp domain-containing protein [unclassified Pseudomonas]PMX03688.1 carboxylate--amine ligase [Pseudomonas sp. FW215-R2]PMX13086.1 carboxylate--amine ligase [Pseudomonas sp. FW215-L1]PMX19931.1 carboxylate--amine ligase [Pseudomonas sp. FW215-E1]PNA25782.1 carboxylate--amine ligase [Pseudomonas sp. FW215-R4]
MIWFLEGQSSQRDVIIGAREALPADVKIFASHRQDRPEITSLADVSFTEPGGNEERIDWVIATAVAHNIKLILAGRVGNVFEIERARFEQAGLELVTGGTSMATFDMVDDKSRFTAEAERVGLACVPAITALNAEEMFAAYKTLSASGEVCVKPAVGIYGQGFWRFKADTDPFRCFANPDAREANFETYMRAYCEAEAPAPMLMMPYMAGSECSVDMVCEAGRPVAFVSRRKAGVHQTFEREGPAVELALKAAEHFGCDGIVNVQTRDDADGQPHLLEINPRYSGGIGYTRATGTNLPGIFAARRLGLPEPATVWRANVRVKGVTVAAVAS